MDAVAQFSTLMRKADDYHKEAQWEEKLRVLQEALSLCEQPGFPDAARHAQQVLFDLGGLRRRFGQHDAAIDTLEQALQRDRKTGDLVRAKILGELGVVYRHGSQFTEAKSAFQQQFDLSQGDSLEAQTEACRAIGNLGMTIYNLSQQTQPQDEALLSLATAQIKSRIARAQHLQQLLSREESSSRQMSLLKTWENIGLYRLTLCLVAADLPKEAVRTAELARSKDLAVDPTVKAFSRYFYGNALWADGRRDDALLQWNPEPGICSPAIAICMEPASEFVEYLQRLAWAGVDFGSCDEHGFNALDYATVSNTADAETMVQVIITALRTQLSREMNRDQPDMPAADVDVAVERDIARRVRQSRVRGAYRAVFQEQMRPQLKRTGPGRMSQARALYAKQLHDTPTMMKILDDFRSVPCSLFQRLGRFPTFSEVAEEQYCTSGQVVTKAPMGEGQERTDHVVFISYRWIGREAKPPVEGPDDGRHTQWHRINDALTAYLACHPKVDADDLHLWLDYACIDQEHEQLKTRGVDTLPLCVTLCDAMISLVDDSYYDRAWCAVECMLIRELVRSYTHYEWWEHVPQSTMDDMPQGYLREGGERSLDDLRELKLTEEKADRPTIAFLVRQSKLLGRVSSWAENDS